MNEYKEHGFSAEARTLILISEIEILTSGNRNCISPIQKIDFRFSGLWKTGMQYIELGIYKKTIAPTPLSFEQNEFNFRHTP